MPGFVKVAKTDEITPGRGKTVQANGNKVALFNRAYGEVESRAKPRRPQ